MNEPEINTRKPQWLKSYFKNPEVIHEVKKGLRARGINTVCESAKCPNICECFGRKTATFMIMGDVCTRNCGFCAVRHGKPHPLEATEPLKIAEMVCHLGLRHVVVTSVTRDDLPDGGASQFAATINEIRYTSHEIRIEVLTPDFNGDQMSIKEVLAENPDVFNHNLETVFRLTGMVRSGADYRRSLGVLAYARGYSDTTTVKSGLMVGFGETDEEIFQALNDLSRAGADIVTIGQYLMPSKNHLPVKRYVPPEVFERYKKYGESIGIKKVFSGPLVRSSYHAFDAFKAFRAF